MARKKVGVSLDTLIPQYAENKSLLDDYKKICDEENKQIKDMMEEGSYEAGGWKATKSVTTRDSMNEEKLLDVLTQNKLYQLPYKDKIIKTKTYVDMDALESAIYKGLIPKEVLLKIDKCRESKEVVTLRISKVKEKKDAEN